MTCLTRIKDVFTISSFFIKRMWRIKYPGYEIAVVCCTSVLLLILIGTLINARMSQSSSVLRSLSQDPSYSTGGLHGILTKYTENERKLSFLRTISTFSRHDYLNKERINYMYKMCSLKAASLVPEVRMRITYFQSQMYNFNYCLVPKAGCSFWMQVLNILELFGSPSEMFFKTARKDLHRSENLEYLFIHPTRVIEEASPTIITSRDPYSRLFSVFIDKIYVPNMWYIAEYIGNARENHTKSCGNDVTFEEFLRALFHAAYKGHFINKHWAPVSLLCRPCDVNTSVIVKQESFAEDVLFALQTFRVSNKTMETIRDALYTHRVEATIPGIVRTIYANTNFTNVQNCFGIYELARRIWRSFIVQGFIKEEQDFPRLSEINSELLPYPDHLTQLILDNIRRHPITKEQSRKQRRQFLVNAYKSLTKRTIVQIKRFYKDDFLLFNYTFDVPT